MADAFDFSAFDRATDPLFRLLTPEQTRAIADFRGDERLSRRVEELAAKCDAGQLTEGECAEYEAYASANHLLALLQAKARRRLGDVSPSACDAESIDPEETAAAQRLRARTPSNNILLKLTQRATVPPEIQDIQEERPW